MGILFHFSGRKLRVESGMFYIPAAPRWRHLIADQDAIDQIKWTGPWIITKSLSEAFLPGATGNGPEQDPIT